MPIHLAAQFVKRGTATKGVLDVEPTTTIEQLRKNVEHMFHVHPYQQGLLLSTGAKGPDGKEVSIKLDGRSRTLADFAADDRDGFDLSNPALVLTVKDYGRQVDYATVFVVEYLGPILIMMAYAARPSLLYGEGASKREWNWVAKWGVFAWLAHFVKRELETFFVHKFSNPTMPFFNIFKNSIYYWGFALVVGLPLCHPDYSAPANTQQVYLGAALMAVAELINFAVHVQLRLMPPPEGKKRAVPGGPLFALVSCPNYTAEVLSWVGFSIMTQIGFAYLFTLVGFAQMSEWALNKHRNYIKNDPEYKRKGRKAIVPFLL